jgi:hypothetical protein
MKNQIQNDSRMLSNNLFPSAKKIVSFVLSSLLIWSITITSLQAQCPDAVATNTITASNTAGGALTINGPSVYKITGSVVLGSTANIFSITVGVGGTLIITAGSHLKVQNLAVSGTLIIQEGATVSLGLAPGVQGSYSQAIGSTVKMCSYSGLENCGTSTFSEGTSIQYVGDPAAKAIVKFDKSIAPNPVGTLSMPNGAPQLTASSNIVLATPPAGTPLFNQTGGKGSATACSIGTNCTGLPFTVGPQGSCGEFFGQTAVGPCLAGTTGPALTATTKSNICPATTVDLTTISATNLPTGGVVLEWHTGTPATAANKVATPSAVTAGTYYAVFYDATFNCYSNTSGTTGATAVTATSTACVTCNAGSTAPTLSATTIANTCPATIIDLTTITATNLPAGTVLEWHTATPATSANKVAAPNTVTAGTYYAVFFDATNNCYSNTSGATGATSVTATSTACVACNAGSTAPILIKN